MEQLREELRILNKLKNTKGFIHFEKKLEQGDNIFIFMEYFSGGDLYSLLKLNKIFKEKQAIFFAGQIVLMLEQLHSQGIVHRDLKPENILLNPDKYLVLADFGLSKQIKDRSYTLCGTPEYLAPEILNHKGYGSSVDWWALGVLVYEMIIGFTPFYAEEPMEIFENILKKKVLFTMSVSGSAKSFMKRLLKKKQIKRFGGMENGIA